MRLVFGILLTVIASLARGASSKKAPAPSATPTAVVMKDARGEAVRVKRPPQRIISLAPSVTECLFALGAGKRVVGVTKFCSWPEDVAKIQKIGDFSRPSVEKIVSLKPDLVVAAKGNDLKVLGRLKAFRIPVFATDFQTVDDVVGGMETLGTLLGDPAAGARARDEILEGIRKAVIHVPPNPKKRLRVYWGGWEDTLYTAGGGTLVDDLIRRAGGINIGAEAGDGWPQLSLEALAKADPEVFLLGYMAPESSTAEVLGKLRTHPVWARIQAVKSGRIHNISTDLIGHPSPRCVEGLRELVRVLWGAENQATR